MLYSQYGSQKHDINIFCKILIDLNDELTQRTKIIISYKYIQILYIELSVISQFTFDVALLYTIK